MQRRHFTQECKAEAVRQALLPGVSRAQVAQDLGIHGNMLRKWIRPAPTRSGWRISPTSAPAKAGCTWRSFWIFSVAAQWAGR